MNYNLSFIFHIYNFFLLKTLKVLQIYQSNNNFLKYNIQHYRHNINMNTTISLVGSQFAIQAQKVWDLGPVNPVQ